MRNTLVSLLAATVLSGVAMTPAMAKTLVYCSEGAPEGFDAALYSANSTWDASAETIYDRLTEFESGTTKVVPGLAESWTVSGDNLEYTLKLRHGVKFQASEGFTPTRDFNADDVLFTYKRQLDKNDPWNSYFPGANWEMFNAMEMPSIIKDIVKIDDSTVKFVLNQPDGSLPSKLALNFGSIMSKEYADKLAAEGRREDLDRKPLGTGPFRFVDYQQDAAIRFAANADYWGGAPKIDNLIFAITTDATTRMQKLQAGECHVAPYPAPADVAGLKANPDLNVLEQPGLNISYLAMNTLVAPFDKLEVRQAINMAIDRKAIVSSVYQGMGQVAESVLPPTMWGYNGAVEGYGYDPETAKKLLEKAGVKDLKMKIWAMPVSRPYMPNARRAAELMQADLAKVGIGVEIVSYEWGEYLKKVRDEARDGAVILGGTSDNGDPDNLLGYFFSCAGVGGSNNANWCYKPLEEALQKARISSNQDERTKLYEEAQVMISDQAPWVPIANSTVVLPMSKKVKGYVMEPLGSHRFDKVDIDE
ncbi:MAG TPA: ABC transporter substrate-binding protein [Ensifer sp.]|uniref:ABC transporter substrate-binding protein n=1 Tax=Ensifer sp. TaxID=1872086 RepID=UPI002E15EF16|nr:ABC transporter substrate-binding protein [Ensifer sp.]